MATEIVKAEVSIVLRPNLEGVESAIEKVHLETNKLAAIEAKVQELGKIDTPEKCGQAKLLMAEVRSIGKQAALNLDPYWEVIKRVSDHLSNEYTLHEDRAKWIDDGLKAQVKVFEQQEREAAQREQDKINAENARVAREAAEKKRRADEAAAIERRKERVEEIRGMLKRHEITKRVAERLLREAGANEEADKAKAAADEEAAKNTPPPQVTVKPNIPTNSAVRTRINYHATVQQPDLIINAFLDAVHLKDTERAVYLRQFVTVNERAVDEEARTVKDSKKMATLIPGVRFYED